MKNYKELNVWNRAVALAVHVCRVTKGFPPDERFALSAQIRRAATSVPANFAEGWGRGSTREYIQFLLIARGSLMEVETQAVIAHQLLYLTKPQIESVQQQIEEIGKMLNGLIQALRAPRGPRSA